MKGQYPRAYLRMDPNLDKHPEREWMLVMICEANRMPRRGRFDSLTQVERILGRARAKRFLEPRRPGKTPDVVQQPDGSYYLDGWDEWQEGDLTVGERVRRLRAKRFTTVTSTVTPALHARTQASGGKASGDNNDPPDPPARAGGPSASGNGHGPPTKTEQDQTVRELSAYWRWLGSCDPRAPGGWTDTPATLPADANVRAWRRALRDGRLKVAEVKAGIAERVRKDLTQLGIPVWDVEPWPPPEFTPEESLQLARERLSLE